MGSLTVSETDTWMVFSLRSIPLPQLSLLKLLSRSHSCRQTGLQCKSPNPVLERLQDHTTWQKPSAAFQLEGRGTVTYQARTLNHLTKSSIQKILITLRGFTNIGKQLSLPLTAICLCKLKNTTVRRKVRQEESQNSFVGRTRDSFKFTLLYIGVELSASSESPPLLSLKHTCWEVLMPKAAQRCASPITITLQGNPLKVTTTISYRIWK